MVVRVQESRQGRQLQRYSNSGNRLIVGCIPYKLKKIDNPFDCGILQCIEVLVVSSPNREEFMFPKGGWELDESMFDAAHREAYEEAGVLGNLEVSLGNWRYKSKRQEKYHDAVMFPLNVTEEDCQWPEMACRKRKWANVAQVMEECNQGWMKEALARLVARLASSDMQSTLHA